MIFAQNKKKAVLSRRLFLCYKIVSFIFSKINIFSGFFNHMNTNATIKVKDETVKLWIENRLTEVGRTANVQIA